MRIAMQYVLVATLFVAHIIRASWPVVVVLVAVLIVDFVTH